MSNLLEDILRSFRTHGTAINRLQSDLADKPENTSERLSSSLEQVSKSQTAIEQKLEQLRVLFSDPSRTVGDALSLIGAPASRVIRGDIVEDSAEALSLILSTEHEREFWQSLADAPETANPQRARAIANLVTEINSVFAAIHRCDSGREWLKHLESNAPLQDTLNSLWQLTVRPPYPQVRMERLLSLGADELIHAIQTCFHKHNVWTNPFQSIHDRLVMAARSCERLVQMTRELVDQYWVPCATHRWDGPAPAMQQLQDLMQRLDDLAGLRKMYQHIQDLLPAEQNRDEQITALFQPLLELGDDVFRLSSAARSRYEAAKAAYERNLEPMERLVAEHLRIRLPQAHDTANALQSLNRLHDFRELLARPTIAREMTSELDTLLGRLFAEAQTLRDLYDTRDQRDSSAAARNMPHSVAHIQWTLQIATRASDIRSKAQVLLHELPRCGDLLMQLQEIKDDFRAHAKECFHAWVEETKDAINGGTSEEGPNLALEMTGKLMEINLDGNLVVSYSDRFATFLREVRELGALGFKIPTEIRKVAKTAALVYPHAQALKRVACFYNQIAQEIVPSQKPMLLDAANHFEEIVQHPVCQSKQGEGSVRVTWNNTQQLDAYMDRLQQAAENLTTTNSRLRKLHMKIAQIVVQLVSTDLVRHAQTWRDSMAEIRRIIDGPEEQGLDTRAWKLHWDHQIYKAMRYQFQEGLRFFHYMISGSISITFVNREVRFQPSMCEIRQQYFRDLRAFILRPASFSTLCKESRKLFSSLASQCTEELQIAYMYGEDLMQRLEMVLVRYSPITVLGRVDLVALVEGHVHELNDWEINFKILKERSKQIQQLPDVERVENFSISTVPVKSAAEDQHRRLGDILLNTLRQSAATSLQEVDEFITRGTESLGAMPQSVLEISAAKELSQGLRADLPEHKDKLAKVAAKNALLRRLGGVQADVRPVEARWGKLIDMLSAYDARLMQQSDNLRGMIGDKIQQLKEEVGRFATRWEESKPRQLSLQDEASVAATRALVDDCLQESEALKKQIEELDQECKCFELTTPPFPEIEPAEEEMRRLLDSLEQYEQWSADLSALADEDWAVIRAKSYLFEDFLDTWAEKIKSLGRTPARIYITDRIEEYRQLPPLLKLVRGDVFTSEHWARMFHILEFPKGTTPQTLKLRHFLDRAVLMKQKQKPLKELHNRAHGEVKVREALDEVKLWSQEAVFSLTQHVSRGRTTALIEDFKEILTQVDDKLSLLSSLKGASFYESFKSTAEQWESQLSELNTLVHLMNTIQRKWVYLEPIFLRGAIPQHQQRFLSIDEQFRGVMAKLADDPRVLPFRELASESLLTAINTQLDRCQQALSDYLEEKRSRFPRFYFLGDDDLLEILGQSQNPSVIQVHLKKLFQGIHSVIFSEDNQFLVAMCSAAQEQVPLVEPVPVTECVEDWLTNLAKEMKRTLHSLLIECLQTTDLRRFPAQVLSLAENVRFTSECEAAIQGSSLANLQTDLRRRLQKLTEIDTSHDKLLGLKINGLVLDLIHQIDIVGLLIKESVKSLADWPWLKQMRYKIANTATRDVLVSMCDATFEYTFEYQGNAPRLVHTPLTDKCYLTLTQAMRLGYGGHPYGPAGTGKTESVKALGQAMGRQVLVFNCDEGIDFKSMGRIFIGIVKCGAWGCFDEFNRLEEMVLSAISQQIQAIQAALKAGQAEVELLGRSIDVDPNAGIFVTMNPAGKGYGGRSKLPDNLKQLFRSVAMSKPDNELIAEALLFAEGFQDAKQLSKKLVSIFGLAKDQLSPQQHYDWGLRALKTVLTAAGNLLKADILAGQRPDAQRESELVVQALRINSLSKLTFADASRFLGLLRDTFLGIEAPQLHFAELEGAIKEALKEMKLEEIPSQIRKIAQFSESLRQRMGVVLVGPSGCGKTTVWRVLQAALAKLGTQLHVHTMNPKAMPRTQLLGYMDHDTRKWYDGVLTSSARDVVAEPEGVNSWIISDGDIDPEWVESLNSVLDDNRLLTLPSGARIQFPPNMPVNFIFETDNLRFASPATVSRMAVIFLSDEDLDVSKLVHSWVLQQPEAHRIQLGDLMDSFFDRALQWVLRKTADGQGEGFALTTTRMGTVRTALAHLVSDDPSRPLSRNEFVLGLARGLGANLSRGLQVELATQIFSWAGITPPNPRDPLACTVDMRGDLIPLRDQIEGSLSLADVLAAESGGCIVSTVDVQSTKLLFEDWLRRGEPFLLVGPEGAGKNMLLQDALAALPQFPVATVHCTAQTFSQHVIEQLKQHCVPATTAHGRVLRPRTGDRLVLYLADLHLPRPDKYATVEVVAFAQQLLTYGGFYDNDNQWVSTEAVQLVASVVTTAASQGGASEDGGPTAILSMRFTAGMRVAHVPYPAAAALQNVYACFLQPILAGLPIVPAERLAACMVDIYTQTAAQFTTESHPHYVFTPRDLTRWTTRLSRYAPENGHDLLCALAYEALRIFRDRLVTTTDHPADFNKLLLQAMQTHFGPFQQELCDREGTSVLETLQNKILPQSRYTELLYYSTFAAPAMDAGSSMGIFGPSLRRLRMHEMEYRPFGAVVQRGITQFEREVKDLNLMPVPEVLENIAHLDRVLSWPGESALLVGQTGIGRRSQVHLVAHMHGMKIFSPLFRADASDNGKPVRAFVKQVLAHCIVENQPAVLFAEDHHLEVQGCGAVFLSLLTELLISGNAPALYTNDEFEALLSQLKDEMEDEENAASAAAQGTTMTTTTAPGAQASEGGEDGDEKSSTLARMVVASAAAVCSPTRQMSTTALPTGLLSPSAGQARPSVPPPTQREQFLAFMKQRIRRNLHIVISIDPSNNEFESRLSLNPALFTRCTVLWYGRWSQQSMKHIAMLGLKPIFEYLAKNFEKKKIDAMKRLIVQAVMRMHLVAVLRGASPQDYMRLIQSYCKLFKDKLDSVMGQQSHLRAGLTNLSEAANLVDQLSREAAARRTALAEKQAEADQALSQIQVNFRLADEKKRTVATLTEQLQREEAELLSSKAEIDEKLGEIQPMIEQAKRAVGQIDQRKLDLMRSLRMPPKQIQDVLSGVLCLLGIFDTSWSNIKKFLVRRDNKEAILNYDARSITPQTRRQAMKLLNERSASFEPSEISRVSAEAASLAIWVRANVKYSFVLESIAPLEESQQQFAQSLHASKARLVECEQEEQMLDAQIKQLEQDFKTKTAEAQTLKLGLNEVAEKLASAQDLLEKLSGERARWAEQVQTMDKDLERLPVRTLLAAGFATYLCKESEDVRQKVVRDWCQWCRSELGNNATFSFHEFMALEAERLRWKAEGLPADALSIENAVMILQGHQSTPFIVDPTEQAFKWLREHLEAEARENKKDSVVDVITQRDRKFVQAIERAVRFGRTVLIQEVDVIDPILYPFLRRDVSRVGPRPTVQLSHDKTCEFDEDFRIFLFTRNPDARLPPDAAGIVTEANFTVTRAGLESQLLSTTILHEQPTLEDQKSQLLRKEEQLKVDLSKLEKDLLNQLATSTNILDNKELVAQLNMTKQKSQTISEALEESRRLQESLDTQRGVYQPLAAQGARMFFLIRRLPDINPMYQFSLPPFLALFTRTLATAPRPQEVEERLRVLQQMLERLVLEYVSRSLFKQNRLTFAVHFACGLRDTTFRPEEWDVFTGKVAAAADTGVSLPSWVPPESQVALRRLLAAVPGLYERASLQDAELWRPWVQHPRCEMSFPTRARISAFQGLLLVQALRGDRLLSAMHRFVTESLGIKSIDPPPLNLLRVVRDEASAGEPVLLITTPGTDPTRELEEAAAEVVGTEGYLQIPMGQGQAAVAIAALQRGAREGLWICLKNLHLVTPWLVELEKEFNALSNPHANFRLILTTEPHPKFSVILLQQSLKLTYEAPPGIKKNLLRTYEAWTPKFVAQGGTVRAQLLFLVAWLHAVVQERRTYIPQAWTKFYEFSSSDLRSGADIVDVYCRGDRVRWPSLHGLLGTTVYGGRVDNPYDDRILQTYLALWFNSDVVHGSSRFKLASQLVLPTSSDKADYLAVISQLPDMDSPLLFHLPANIERTVQQAQSQHVIADLRSLAHSLQATTKFDRAAWREELDPLIQLWAKLCAAEGLAQMLPHNLDRIDAARLDPLATFVYMELRLAADLVALVDGLFTQLDRVLSGAALLTPEIHKTGLALFKNAVPDSFATRWDGPETPALFLESLARRAAAIRKGWFGSVFSGERGNGTALLARPLDLSELFRPVPFLNALKQETARSLRTSMDALVLTSSWSPASRLASSRVINLVGLQLQGAAWDGALQEAQPDTPSTIRLPSCAVAWVPADQGPAANTADEVPLPLYFDTGRTRSLMELRVPCSGEPAMWVLAGAALFLGS